MLEVGIPVYKARDTLPAALDSLVVQTKKNFIVCLSIDGDNEDYSDIIREYQKRGLKIRVINNDINTGAGPARQRILDTTQCDYISFLDADDLFMPRTVEILYTQAKIHNYDILKSSFIREMPNDVDMLMSANENIITWFHGKIYKVRFLKEKNIRFRNDLLTDEDSYFNAVAWNSTENKGLTEEVLYIWRANKQSITRSLTLKDYFIKTYINYIKGQVEALKYLFKINDSIPHLLITNTLLNIYYYYMKARFYHCDEKIMDDSLSSLQDEKWMQLWLQEGSNWIDVIKNIKSGDVYDNEYVVFFDETFNKWAARLLKKEIK